tara:strand:- start:337 stop:636 length:300 start_codon:yes stop_codon:yes gene_type:complete
MDDQELLSQNIITTLGLQDLPDEEKLDITNRVIDIIQKRTMLRMTEFLASEDDEVIKELGGDFERLVKYIKAKVPNFDQVLQEEILAVKRELIETAQAA